MTLSAYHNARNRAETPRATEYRLMNEITGEMLAAQESGFKGAMLMPSLDRNRQMWATFSSACASNGNGLPDDLRARIVSLGLWVDRFTSDVIRGRESVNELISLNRTVMDGLKPQRLAA